MFNSLKYAKKLEEVGVSREQAEVHMQIMSEIVETNLATKQDILDLRRDLKDVEAGLENKIDQIELRLVAKLGKLMVGAITVYTGIIGAIVAIASFAR